MSKQANQKYRKEKERQHLKKAGIDLSANSGRRTEAQEKQNHSLENRDNIVK
jgi:hypothetical protein